MEPSIPTETVFTEMDRLAGHVEQEKYAMIVSVVKAHHTVLNNPDIHKTYMAVYKNRARAQGILEDLLDIAKKRKIEIRLPQKGTPPHDQGKLGPSEDDDMAPENEDTTLVEPNLPEVRRKKVAVQNFKIQAWQQELLEGCAYVAGVPGSVTIHADNSS